MKSKRITLSRRAWLQLAVYGAGALGIETLGTSRMARAQQPEAPPLTSLPGFTGPGANPYWNSVGPFATYPQKQPLVLLTDRPVQLETPRNFLQNAITPNSAFYVRWHLDQIPTGVNLAEWRLRVEGNVAKSLQWSLADLMTRFTPVTVIAVNQCSGNSRSRFQPRVTGGQWGNGAMGNAAWTGVPLKRLIAEAAPRTGSIALQFQGLESGEGPQGKGSSIFLKSLDLDNPVLEEAIVAYGMNGEPLPMLNGFPVRLIVPGYFATYWMKCLTWIRVLDKPDENFWMKTAYRVPETPRGNTTPEDVKAGRVKMVPISRMPVRSFLISPDASDKIPAGMPVRVRGIAFSGSGPVLKVELTVDNGKTWNAAQLGQDLGPYSFRTWEATWKPSRPGRYTLAVRATDAKNNVQPDAGVWNPGGYLWNKIERQDFVVGASA